MRRYQFIFLSVIVLLLTACENEAYESGDAKLSYLHADFVMARTAEAKQFVEATNDDGQHLTLHEPLSCEWATTADSTYRALLYYTFNPEEDDAPHALSVVSVPVLQPRPLKANEVDATDPVGWESTWLSAHQPYLNLSILLKTGVEEGLDNKQVIGIVQCEQTQNSDGTTTHHLSFYHQQNGVPQYYTSRIYVSIPTAGYQPGDILRLTVNTYNGVQEKDFQL